MFYDFGWLKGEVLLEFDVTSKTPKRFLLSTET